MTSGFHSLSVGAIHKPIDDATTVTFDVPDGLAETFAFQPGQHLVIEFVVDGAAVRRTYSINSCARSDEKLQITVKRVAGGVVSNHVNDTLNVGDTLNVMPPQGRFCARVEPKQYKTYFLFAAGSGVTPIMSILKSVLAHEPKSFVRLFYGNKNKSSTLFRDELFELSEAYPDRLQIAETMSAPYSDWKALGGWKGRKGIIDAEAVRWFVDTFPPPSQDTEYFACGPGTMNITVRDTLLELGVPKERVHIEQFGPLPAGESNDSIQGTEATLLVQLRGKSHEVRVDEGQTLLSAMRAQGVDPPYSCESGVCATCVATLRSGSVHMRANMALDDDELAQGQILTCQSVATSAEVSVDFNQ